MRKLAVHELGRVSADKYQYQQKFPIAVVLDNIRSMSNVGAVFRTSDAFSVKKVILSGYTPSPPHREIQKTALGATESVEWIHYPGTRLALEEIKKEGYKVILIEHTTESIALSDFSWQEYEPVCIVLGNEATGVSEDILDLADAAIEIPQFGTKHSLNVSVAAGVVLWDYISKNKLIR